MISELPLFPLNTVLFPGMPINLHIFEPRYLEMIQYCLENLSPFGVMLIAKGKEALGELADPYLVGCTARIIRRKETADHRLNITAIGGERVHLRMLDRSQPFLIGEVELMPYPHEDHEVMETAAKTLRPWLNRYIKLLIQANRLEDKSYPLPQSPVELGFLGAHLLQINPKHKQEILEAEQASEMIRKTQAHYPQEIALLKTILDAPEPKQDESRLYN